MEAGAPQGLARDRSWHPSLWRALWLRACYVTARSSTRSQINPREPLVTCSPGRPVTSNPRARPVTCNPPRRPGTSDARERPVTRNLRAPGHKEAPGSARSHVNPRERPFTLFLSSGASWEASGSPLGPSLGSLGEGRMSRPRNPEVRVGEESDKMATPEAGAGQMCGYFFSRRPFPSSCCCVRLSAPLWIRP